MRTRFQGEIVKIEKAGGGAIVTFEAEGKVEKAGPTAKEATIKGTIFLKTLVSNEMKMGSTLTITLTDEEPSERLD